jgi:hypothetical protein
MKTIHFHVGGFDRSYYHFFVGFGLFVTMLMVFAAIVALPGNSEVFRQGPPQLCASAPGTS